MQFLSNSPAISNKYTDIQNCWKRELKLDYLALNEKKNAAIKKRNSKQAAKKHKICQKVELFDEDITGVGLEEYSSGEDVSGNEQSDEEEETHQDNIEDDSKIIHKLTHQMEVVEQQLENKKKEEGKDKLEETDLM
eukprot:1861056-Ditylum_brightwellii.AAC.1